MTVNPMFHGHKHIGFDYHFVREKLTMGATLDSNGITVERHIFAKPNQLRMRLSSQLRTDPPT